MAAPVFVADEVVTATKMNSLPKGILGYAQVTSNQGPITTEVDLTGLSVTVDVAASRRIKITGQVSFAAGSSTTVLRVKEGTTVFQSANMEAPGGNSETLAVIAVIAPSSGSHTYKLSAQAVGTGTNTNTSATNPAFILVEDIGSSV